MKYLTYEFVVTDRTMIAEGGSYSFRNYTDIAGVFGNPGAVVLFDDGSKDSRGNPIGKPFSISQSHYKLLARDGQKDYKGLLLSEYFLNAPFCEGSPNGVYTNQDGVTVSPDDLGKRKEILVKLRDGELSQHNVKIKLMETERDAEIALDAGLKRAEAQMSVGQIDDETLSEISALFGVFGKPDKMMRQKLFEIAGKRPIDYFKHMNSGDRSVRALIRKGLADGVLKQKGPVIFWEETLLGSDEDSSVATLIADPKILEALSNKVGLKAKTKKK